MRQNSERSRAEGMAEAMGVVVGAASTCDSIGEDRVRSAVGQIGTLISAAAIDDADAKMAEELFYAGFDAGKHAVETGGVDPKSVERAFGELEETLPTSEPRE